MRITRELYKPLLSEPHLHQLLVLKLPDDPNVRHSSLTRALKGRDCDGGDTGLREMKPLAWGQRASERDEGPLQTCTLLEAPRLPEGLPMGPQGLRLAQVTGPVFPEVGRHFCPLFLCMLGWASFKLQTVVGHFHSPSQVLSLERRALW